jgi:hypothetical protein
VPIQNLIYKNRSQDDRLPNTWCYTHLIHVTYGENLIWHVSKDKKNKAVGNETQIVLNSCTYTHLVFNCPIETMKQHMIGQLSIINK